MLIEGTRETSPYDTPHNLRELHVNLAKVSEVSLTGTCQTAPSRCMWTLGHPGTCQQNHIHSLPPSVAAGGGDREGGGGGGWRGMSEEREWRGRHKGQ